jgi:hypothetical protein
LFAAALVLAACASTIPATPESTIPVTPGATISATPDSIALAVQPPPVGNACNEALGRGRLVADPRSGLAIAGGDGRSEPVMWPFGFSAALVDGRIFLVDQNGQAIAGEGDTVEFGGGLGLNDFFWVCPAEVKVVARAN